MRFRTLVFSTLPATAIIAVAVEPRLDAQHAVRRAIDGRPDALVDLRTAEGVRLVGGQWRYHNTSIVEAELNDVKTHDIAPKAGGADFDDSSWEAIEPATLEARRTAGKLSFNWYRTGITIPSQVGAFDTSGATVVFEIVVDDYAEIWVDGQLPRVLGQTGSRPGLQRAESRGAHEQCPAGPADSAGDSRRERTAVGPAVELHLGPLRLARILQTRCDEGPIDAGEGHPHRSRARRHRAAERVDRTSRGRFSLHRGPRVVLDGYLLFSDPNSNTIYPSRGATLTDERCT